jgi:lactate dehydrogenase-like 2-hydroxyacid dehydrogenase
LNIVILDALTFGDTSLEGFQQFGDVSIYETTMPQETAARIANADVIVTNKVVITREHLLTCKQLKRICVAATGMNNVDLDAAKERGVSVKNVAGYSTDSVIQHTFSMLFYLIGHARYYDDYVKSGTWQQSPVFTNVQRPFFEIKGKTWGIIGLGAIGQGVANMARAFGAEVIYYSTSKMNQNREYLRVELETLLQNSDIISIHAPLNDATKNLIDLKALMQMKRGAVLLNLGRGGIVNEADLARVIDARELYAGLDVLEQEPMKTPHPLLHVKHPERLYITPHIAWTSIEARERLISQTIENIKGA